MNTTSSSTSTNGNEVAKPSILKMIWSPDEQLRNIKSNPIFGKALLLLVILGLLNSCFIIFNVDPVKILQGKEIPHGTEGFIKGFLIVISVFTAIVTPIIGSLISSIVHYIFAKIKKCDVTFKQLYSMNVHILIIGILGGLFNSILIFITDGDPTKMLTSFGSMFNTGGVLGAILSKIEFFGIWQIILVAIGLQKVGNFPKGYAWFAAIFFFAVSTLYAVFRLI